MVRSSEAHMQANNRKWALIISSCWEKLYLSFFFCYKFFSLSTYKTALVRKERKCQLLLTGRQPVISGICFSGWSLPWVLQTFKKKAYFLFEFIFLTSYGRRDRRSYERSCCTLRTSFVTASKGLPVKGADTKAKQLELPVQGHSQEAMDLPWRVLQLFVVSTEQLLLLLQMLTVVKRLVVM